MKRWVGLALALILLVEAQPGLAAPDRLKSIPYDPATDLPKLASDLGLPESEVSLQTRCVFARLAGWSNSASMDDFATCLLVITPNRLVLVGWNGADRKYVAILGLGATDISTAALSIEGAKHQLQLTTKSEFLAVTTAKLGVTPPGDSSEASEALALLKRAGVTVVASPGRVELSMPRSMPLYLKR